MRKPIYPYDMIHPLHEWNGEDPLSPTQIVRCVEYCEQSWLGVLAEEDRAKCARDRAAAQEDHMHEVGRKLSEMATAPAEVAHEILDAVREDLAEFVRFAKVNIHDDIPF